MRGFAAANHVNPWEMLENPPRIHENPFARISRIRLSLNRTSLNVRVLRKYWAEGSEGVSSKPGTKKATSSAR